MMSLKTSPEQFAEAGSHPAFSAPAFAEFVYSAVLLDPSIGFLHNRVLLAAQISVAASALQAALRTAKKFIFRLGSE